VVGGRYAYDGITIQHFEAETTLDWTRHQKPGVKHAVEEHLCDLCRVGTLTGQVDIRILELVDDTWKEDGPE
jgi:hypothetical protein